MKRVVWLAVLLLLAGGGCSCRQDGSDAEPVADERDEGSRADVGEGVQVEGRKRVPRRQVAGFNSGFMPPAAEPDEWVRGLEVYVPRSGRRVEAEVQEEGGFREAVEKMEIVEDMRRSAREKPESPFALSEEDIDELARRDELVIE